MGISINYERKNGASYFTREQAPHIIKLPTVDKNNFNLIPLIL